MRILLIVFVIASFNNCLAQCKHISPGNNFHTTAANNRSDTMDVLNYTINLNITDFSTKNIFGNTAVQFTPKMNGVSHITLDLLELIVDSIKMNNATVTYVYNDTLLKITLPSIHNIGDTSTAEIYYHGVPQFDPTWGGFYFNSGYAFNMGVGFDANPHNYGRVWFPCFDNFVERSTFTFNITTNGGKVAYCNGLLSDDTTYTSGDRMRTWIMNHEIPTYLANVAVANYSEVNQIYNGIANTIPIVLAAVAGDTTNLKNSFVHLDTALATYENHYGPYLWDKVGYYLVPFTMGAMEHATSISYPRYAANGNTTHETLMAHELSHHWFGDLITCETAADMWINEGMASYSEHLFTESVYGKNAYKNAVRTNHEWVLHYAHITEGSYLAVSGIPHQYTYGDHVYKKGADIAHTMRGYLGDSLFFIGLKSLLNNKKFSHVNSTTFMNEINAATSVNMNDFLNDWILNSGFSHFSIDSFKVTPVGINYNVDVYVRQKLTGAPALHNDVPLELTFYDAAWNKQVRNINLNGSSYYIQVKLPINPVYVGINLDEKINDATAPQIKVFNAPGTFTLSHARMEITISNISDSAFIKVDHNYTAPDSYKIQKPYRLSPNRYWKVDGIIPSTFDASARIYYDGRPTMSNNNGYLDHNLVTITEDSLVLMYRRNAADDWSVFPYYTKYTLALTTDKYGYVTIDSLMQGEYVFAMKDFTAEVNEKKENNLNLHCFPNPTDEVLNIVIENCLQPCSYTITITDVKGSTLFSKSINTNTYAIDCKNFAEGIYSFTVRDEENGFITTKRFVVTR